MFCFFFVVVVFLLPPKWKWTFCKHLTVNNTQRFFRSSIPRTHSSKKPTHHNLHTAIIFTDSQVFFIFFPHTAYLRRGDYNVFTVDWSALTFFPCYLTSLSNSRLVAQCTAQFYSHLTYSGASAYRIHCVGHSLGAHICGMMSNHLTHKIHKIVGKWATHSKDNST